MKAIPATYKPEHSIGHNSTMGASYRATCPHCGTDCGVWPTDYEKRETPAGSGARCEHLDSIDAKGRFVFSKPIVRDGNAEGWWRWAFHHRGSGGDWSYTYGTRDAAEEALDSYMTNSVPWSAHERGGTVEPCVMPPRVWLESARENALGRARDARKRAAWLDAQIKALA